MAYVDIYMEMEYFDPDDELDRRRRLRAFSRFPQTPRHVVFQWNETDYLLLGDVAQVENRAGWERLRGFLETAPCKLSRDEILEDWPAADPPVPSRAALRRWLEEAVADSRLAREGAGTKHDPFLYWLPGKEVEWPDDPLWFLHEDDEPADFDPVKMEKERIRKERREAKKGKVADEPPR
jgi:hypothetical protein